VTRTPTHSRRARQLALLLTSWAALAARSGTLLGRDDGLLAGLLAAVRRRFRRVRAAPAGGLTTVEVAIITAVLLGLATALVAAITVVVNRNTAKIN